MPHPELVEGPGVSRDVARVLALAAPEAIGMEDWGEGGVDGGIRTLDLQGHNLAP
jgi:hypothetical protein